MSDTPMHSDVRVCFGGPHDGVTWETVFIGLPLNPDLDRFVYIMSEDLVFSSAYERGPHPITGEPSLIFRRTFITPTTA